LRKTTCSLNPPASDLHLRRNSLIGRQQGRFESVLECHNRIQNFRISGVIRVFTIEEVFCDQAATAAEMI
jgi:hypothetical protein